MSKWNHNGVDIELNDGGKFVATIKGRRVTKPSLDAMKTAIESVEDFKSFSVLATERYGREHVPMNVVGIRKLPKNFSAISP